MATFRAAHALPRPFRARPWRKAGGVQGSQGSTRQGSARPGLSPAALQAGLARVATGHTGVVVRERDVRFRLHQRADVWKLVAEWIAAASAKRIQASP